MSTAYVGLPVKAISGASARQLELTPNLEFSEPVQPFSNARSNALALPDIATSAAATAVVVALRNTRDPERGQTKAALGRLRANHAASDTRSEWSCDTSIEGGRLLDTM